MVPMSLTKAGLLNPAELTAWKSKLKQGIHDAVKTGMNVGGAPVAAAVRFDVSVQLKIKSKGFLNSFKHKVLDRYPKSLPALLIGSKVPWSGIHQHGGTIRGPLIIPLNVGRPGWTAWTNLLNSLFSSKQAFWKEMGGKVLLFTTKAGIAQANARISSRFWVRFKNPTKGLRIGAHQAVLIGMLMPRVQLRQRIRIEQIARANLGLIASAIKTELNKV
jgi:hypothetical protein